MLPFLCKDVATEPATSIIVVAPGSTLPSLQPDDKGKLFVVTTDCVEPTEGWLHREGKPNLTVCFMHSFGKCTGRTNNDPRTCYQIHIHPKVLHALRQHYTSPPRRYYTRTVKAQIGHDLRQQLSLCAGKPVKVQYLEYRVHDVQPTAGLAQCESAYRQWLFDGNARKEIFVNVAVMQCTSFASTRTCPNGEMCPYIHAAVKNAQVRDATVARALQDFSNRSLSMGNMMMSPPLSHPPAATSALSVPNGFSISGNVNGVSGSPLSSTTCNGSNERTESPFGEGNKNVSEPNTGYTTNIWTPDVGIPSATSVQTEHWLNLLMQLNNNNTMCQTEKVPS